MKACRCKVELAAVAKGYSGGQEVEFRPVCDGSEENKRFHAATPGGSFKMTLSAEAVENLGPFCIGRPYYVDFIPIDVVPVG